MTVQGDLLANDTEFEAKFDAMWNAQLLEYPTISRNEAGKWNYFDVIPEQPEVIYEGGRRLNLDSASEADVQLAQAEDLARQTLELASRYYEADSCALTFVVDAAYAAKQQNADPDLSFVAMWFIEALLVAAVHGRDRI